MKKRKAPIIAILAIADNHVVGSTDPKRPLPWQRQLPTDMNYFTAATTGNGNNVVVMGRKTWETIPLKYRPLPDRHNIILTRDEEFPPPENVSVVRDIDVILQIAETGLHNEKPVEQIFIAGGVDIYRQMIPHADGVYLTRIHEPNMEGDVLYEDLDLSDWEKFWYVSHDAGGEDKYPITFYRYRRKHDQ